MTVNVLVIDDDPDLRETLQLLLVENGFAVTQAAGGQEALDLLPSGPRPNLILLDLTMPGMSGWQFLDRIRGTELGSIPVVIMTARPVIGPLPAPATELLRKPFDRATLLGTIARCGPADQGATASAASASASAPATERSPAVAPATGLRP